MQALEGMANSDFFRCFCGHTRKIFSGRLELGSNRLYESYEPVLVELPYKKGELISLFHEEGPIWVTECQRETISTLTDPELYTNPNTSEASPAEGGR